MAIPDALPPGDVDLEIHAYAKRMRDLEKIKSDLLNLVSHELRGPLAILRGYIEMMEDGSLGELDPQVRSILPIFSAKAGQMSMLVNQMLEAARLEDARLHLDVARIDLRQPVRRAVGLVAGLAHRGQAVLMRAPSTALLVTADAARIETVIANLLDNAIKYSPNGGNIEVSVKRAGTDAVVQVADRGLGIAAEDRPQLFTRFGRIVTPENSHIPGTGLGLYLANEMAKLHGGSVTAAARPGGGSIFSLKLPMHRTIEPGGVAND